MKRLLLAPLLLTLLFGCSSKNSKIINLECPVNVYSYDNKDYKQDYESEIIWKININIKTEEATVSFSKNNEIIQDPVNFKSVSISSTFFNLERGNEIPPFIFKQYFTINRKNGTLTIKHVEEKITEWARGTCYSTDDVETLF